MYAHLSHFIADTYDPDERQWIRYDANYNDGVGVPIDPPTGRAQHDRRSYYATALIYVRCQAEEHGSSPTCAVCE